MSDTYEMTTEDRDKIFKVARKQYELLGCNFPYDDVDELLEYIYNSSHGAEINCFHTAIEAHNIYREDTMTLDEFFEWHGL